MLFWSNIAFLAYLLSLSYIMSNLLMQTYKIRPGIALHEMYFMVVWEMLT